MLNKQYFQTFYALLLKDMTVFNRRWLNRSFDALVWISSVMIVARYIMPLFGVTDTQYGTFTLLGNFAIWGFFEMLTSIAIFLGDIEGNQSILYYVSLPLPSYLLFSEYALASAYRSILSAIFIIPVGKLLLGNDLLLCNINWFEFIIGYIIINIFYGFFTLFVVSYIPDVASLSTVRSRIIFPLWFLGGFQFTWKMSYQVCPTLAYLNLCNPLVYIMDGIRSTALPKELYLPFWNCMAMLILFSLFFGYIGIRNLTKRLDCL